MIQAPKITMELKDFLACPVTAKLLLLHQLLKERTPCCGPRFCNPLNLRSSDQNCLAKTQSTSRWLIVSGAWSHNRHKSGWARALFASLSAVQHLSWWTSQIKNLHCSGDQLVHTWSAGSKNISPWNMALYADLAEYTPEALSFHICWSWTPCWRTFPSKISHNSTVQQ